MNPEYSKIEARRFSQDFRAEFTGFIASRGNTAFFDKTWSSKEHRQKFSKLLANYPLNFHEFESSTLSLEGLKSKIVDFSEAEQSDQSDFSLLCNALEKPNSRGLVMVYRCTELSLASVKLLSDLNAFLKDSKSKWKIAYFGEFEAIYRRHLDLLAPDYIYTPLEFARRPPKIQLSLTTVSTLSLLVFACIGATTYYWPTFEQSYRTLNASNEAGRGFSAVELTAPSARTKATQNWLEQDIDSWQSRVAEFDKAMTDFEGNAAPQNKNQPGQIVETSSGLPNRMSEELIIAVQDGDIGFVDIQINSGVDINILTSNRETLLILASLHGQLELVSWLLRQGAHVGLSDNDNRSALYYAAVNGHLEVTKILLENDASTTQVSRLNKTPLMAAVHNNYLALSSLLLDANSDVNQQDHSGWSALFFAVWNGNSEMTSLLLNHGAKADLKDKDGYTPSDIATVKNNLELVELLR